MFVAAVILMLSQSVIFFFFFMFEIMNVGANKSSQTKKIGVSICCCIRSTEDVFEV